MNPHISLYICCLHNYEVGMLLLLVGEYQSNPLYVLKSTVEAYWTGLPAVFPSPRYDEFIRVYYLTYAVIEIDEVPTEVYLFGEPYWLEAWECIVPGECEPPCWDDCFILRYSDI